MKYSLLIYFYFILPLFCYTASRETTPKEKTLLLSTAFKKKALIPILTAIPINGKFSDRRLLLTKQPSILGGSFKKEWYPIELFSVEEFQIKEAHIRHCLKNYSTLDDLEKIYKETCALHYFLQRAQKYGQSIPLEIWESFHTIERCTHNIPFFTNHLTKLSLQKSHFSEILFIYYIREQNEAFAEFNKAITAL